MRVIVGLEGGTDPLAMHSGGIGVGDRVVRGPSWDWGAGQDGGPGGLGTVVDVSKLECCESAPSEICCDKNILRLRMQYSQLMGEEV